MTASRLFSIGVPLLCAALVLQTTTLATEDFRDYRGLLVGAAVLTFLADVCFVFAFCIGGLVARCLSVALFLPTLFVIADFYRRAPSVFI